MLEPACQEEIARRVRVPQIIVAALVAGLLVFLVIVLVVIQQGFAGVPETAPILTCVALAFALSAVLARLIVPNLIVAQGRRNIIQGTWQVPMSAQSQSGYGQTMQQECAQFVERTGDAGRLLFVFQARTIVAAAVLEGPAFFVLITYMIGRSPLALILAVFLILGVALHFPTQSGVIHWIDDQLRLVEQERQFRR
ncbi:MAG TPA: hypothetical protein VMY37_10425 [Thermoguttaceae bacterium]|nr:hypothetical protein [Thermoguttaceae bacterium]